MDYQNPINQKLVNWIISPHKLQGEEHDLSKLYLWHFRVTYRGIWCEHCHLCLFCKADSFSEWRALWHTAKLWIIEKHLHSILLVRQKSRLMKFKRIFYRQGGNNSTFCIFRTEEEWCLFQLGLPYVLGGHQSLFVLLQMDLWKNGLLGWGKSTLDANSSTEFLGDEMLLLIKLPN